MTVRREIPLSSNLSELCARAIRGYSPSPSDSPVDTPKFYGLLESMVSFGAGFLGTKVNAQVAHVKIYSAGMRSVVVRVSAVDDSVETGDPKTQGQAVIIKHFRRKDSASNSGGFGYLREKEGLAVLNTLLAGSYSALLGFDDQARLLAVEEVQGYPLVLGLIPFGMPSNSDNGSGSDLAFRPDDQLNLILATWVDFWSALLTSPLQRQAQEDFRARLAQADPVAQEAGSLTSPQLAFKGLDKLCLTQGIAQDSAEYLASKAQIQSIIFPAPEHEVLSSGDFSPANLLMDSLTHPQKVQGIDAEGTAVHHWALAVAEFLLGFPSCPWAPLRSEMIESDTWQAAVRRFYREVCPSNLRSSPLDDARVRAAVLTVQCILAEQTA